jgi:hypothetical protein
MNEQQLIAQRQKQLDQIYKPQEQFIKQQQAALPGQFAGQRSALEQAKVNEFRDIGNRAQSKGMFFSGFRPSEEARYLGERFLPGMQDITARQEQARMGLLERLIGLRGQRAEGMMTFQDRLRQERMAREAEERAAQRQMQMARMRTATASAGAAQKASSKDLKNTLSAFAQSRGELSKLLTQNASRDGFVSPASYAAARNAATRAGWSSDLFNRNFARFINPTHQRDYM